MANNERNLSGMNLYGAVDLESLKHKVDAKEGEGGGAPKAGKYVIDVTMANFEAVVRTSATFPVLLLVWLTDDDRCFPMAKRLGDMVNGMEGKMQLARVDAKESPEIVQALRVQGAPALFAILNGQPMPIVQGVPGDSELEQIEQQVVPKLLQVAQQAGITGTAPMTGDGDDASDDDGKPAEEPIPEEHRVAHELAQQGDYSGAAEEYAKVVERNPQDVRAARERAKCLLLARNGSSDVRTVRAAAAKNPDDVDAQLDVADVDMIGGQISDAFDRLLDFFATHPKDRDAVRTRLLEYFAIPDASDSRVAAARRRLATLMY